VHAVIKLARGGEAVAYDWRHLLAECERYVSKSAVALEIGASTPSRTAAVAGLCDRVIAIEYFRERIPPVSPPNVTYIQGDWQSLSDVVEPDSIDIAFSTHVIEHIPDDERALNELYAVLRPGGVAIINTPNRKRLTRAVAEVFTGERKFPWWEHIREYTESDLIELVMRTKFRRYHVEPVAVGVQGGPFWIYSTTVPRILRRFATFWELHLFKPEP
jgi:ubiquinone/menaquinone biosynthesis C-methylase UbiE